MGDEYEIKSDIYTRFICLNSFGTHITRVVFRGIFEFGIIYVDIFLKIVERIYLIIYNTCKIKFKNLKIKYHHFITR